MCPDVQKTVSESKCSAQCGQGEKTISEISLHCPSDDAEGCSIKVQKYQVHCKLKDCPTSITYGPWSPWSECSMSCISETGQNPVRSRVRNCNPHCINMEGNFEIETKECLVPKCPFKCPNFHMRLEMDESDPYKLKVIKLSIVIELSRKYIFLKLHSRNRQG